MTNRPFTVRLPHWLFTPQFVATFRSVMFLCGLAISAGVWAYNQTLGGVRADLATVATMQTERAKDSEAFQGEMRSKVVSVQGDIRGLQGDVFDMKVDIGVIKRLLGDLHHQAALDDPPAVLPPFAAVALSGPPPALQDRW